MASEAQNPDTTDSSADVTNPNDGWANGGAACATGTAAGSNAVYSFQAGGQFSIPAAASITGLKVDIKWCVTDADDALDVILVDKDAVGQQKDIGNRQGANCAATVVDTVGADGDLWGGSWTPAHINSAAFTVQWINDNTAKAGDLFVDSVLVTVYYTIESEDLLGIFDIRQIDSENLLGLFTPRRDASADFLGIFSILGVVDDSENLLGIFDIRRDGSEDLLGIFTPRRDSSEDFFSIFNIRHAASANLLGIFDARQAGSEDLLSIFTPRRDASENLLGIFVISNSGSAELLGIFTPRRDASENLLGIFISRHANSENLLGIFEGQASQDLLAIFCACTLSSEDLFGIFTIRNSASEDLLGIFEARRDGSAELLGIFSARRDGSANLLGIFSARRDGSAELLAIFEGQASQDLLAIFDIQPSGSADLLAIFEIGGVGSAELLAIFEARQAGSAELFAIFSARRDASENLLAIFSPRRSASAELLGIFNIRNSISENLFAIFTSRQSGSAELLAIFEGQASQNLLGIFDIQPSGSADLLGIFTIGGVDSENLLGIFSARQASSAELLGIFEARRDGSAELLGIFESQVIQDLLGIFEARRDGSQNLFAIFDIRNSTSENLLGIFSARRDGSAELLAIFEGQASQDLLAIFDIQPSGSADLLGIFTLGTTAGSADLLGIFDIGGVGSEDLLAIFTSRQAYEELLLGIFTIRGSSSQSLLSRTCVHTPRIGQDLAQWTEYDAGGLLDHDCNDSWWSAVARATQNTSLTTDVGAVGLGSDFFHEFILNMFSVEESPNGALERICAWAGHLAIAVQDFYGQNDFEIAALVAIATDTADEYQLMLIEKGGASDTMATKWPNFQDRYIVIYKQGTSLIANAYQDAAHTILEDSAEIALTGDHNFRYVSMPMAWGQVGAEVSSGYIDPTFGSMENLPGVFNIRRSASQDLFAQFTVASSGSADLAAHFFLGVDASIDLAATFEINYRRIYGENWQRKTWFTDPYYWRAYYSLALDSFVFEYIHKTGLTGNVWTENIAARIDVSGFDAAALEADFSVRGPRSGLPITLVYSDGRDVWIAESDEASATGWDWQNLTRIFDGTAPDWYRRVGVFADRRTPTPGLYVVAVYYDDAPGAVQYVRFSEQTTPGDITGWNAAEDVSNTANTDNILGVAGRSMGATGATKKEVIVVYKEGIAIRSRYHLATGWQAIQTVDATAEAEKSLACFDIEHYETIAGDNMVHIIYIDADNTVRSAERDAGAAVAWGTFVTLDSSLTEHDNVAIITVDTIQFYMWQDGHNIGYRIHRCDPETWWPALANPYNEFDPSTEAVIITTSHPEQIQGPDDIPAGEAVAINWVGIIAAAADRGWGILQAASNEALLGIFTVRRSASVDLAAGFDGQVSVNLHGQFIVRHADSEDLPAEFEIGQGWENLLGQFIARHSASLELHGAFDSQVSLNLPGQFSARRSTQRNLFAEFEVLQGSEDLPGQFTSRPAGAANLLGIMNIVHAVDLGALFDARHSDSAELLGGFTTSHADSAELLCIFFVQGASVADLLGAFVVQHGPSQLSDVVIVEDPDDWINIKISVGTGFLADLQGGADEETKVIGVSSYRSRIDYSPDEHDYIKFGYRLKSWMESDDPKMLYSKYSLCPELEEFPTVSLATNINLCTLNREARISTLASVYDLSVAVT